jgi:hypothetical protein
MGGCAESCSDWRCWWLVVNERGVRVRAWLFKMEC